jgi:DNA-directed RNA polymerase specialized sigma24 family protein
VKDPRRDGGAATLARGRDAARAAWLLQRIGQGDESAMAEFYRLHGQAVLAQILLVAGERTLAEEILQDTMLAIWRGARSFRASRRCVSQ